MSVSDTWALAKKILRYTLASAVVGLFIAAAFATYFDLVDPAPNSQAGLWSAWAAVILCPGTLFFWWFIDAEPGTSGFVFVWVIVGLFNVALYGTIGGMIGAIAHARHILKKSGEPKLPRVK